MKSSSVHDCSIIELNKHQTEKGNSSVVDNSIQIPFDINRIYYLYDIPSKEDRGSHAHKELRQLVVAVCGSFDIILDDGNVKKKFSLNRPNIGLLIVPGIWRELVNFSYGSVCMVLASHIYDENDYIRDYSAFLNSKSH